MYLQHRVIVKGYSYVVQYSDQFLLLLDSFTNPIFLFHFKLFGNFKICLIAIIIKILICTLLKPQRAA